MTAINCLDTLKSNALEALRLMLLTRFTDEKMSKLVRQNKGGTFHMPVTGHEMVGTVASIHLRKGYDWAVPYYRDRAVAIGLGCDLKELFAAFLAKEIQNHSGGRMMPDHFSHKQLKIPCQSSVVGSQLLHAVGIAKSSQLRNTDEIVYVSAGDGACSQGDFHEALNFSCIHKLGIVFVIQDNEWAISVPSYEQTAGANIAKMVSGYEGLDIFECDGSNFLDTNATFEKAMLTARNQRPSIVIAKVPRICPHSSSDDPKKYKSQKQMQDDLAKDPLTNHISWLLKENILSENELNTIKKDCFELVEDAADFAEKLDDPIKTNADKNVFAPFNVPLKPHSISSQESIVMMDALNKALVEEMQKDPAVIVFGQDVARGKGGVFGITRGLTDLFGQYRCFNTPLAESTIVGIAIGLACDGYHKIVAEIQFADYIWTAINQIFNELSSFHYRSNGLWTLPIVLRMPYGGYIQGGPYHSQSIEGYLSHCPGIKIAIPSNAADAKMLLKTAIQDPNPVIFLEHKGLYRQRLFSARPEPLSDEYLPFGVANIVKEGTDVTLIAWGMMVMMANEVCENLVKQNIKVELIDIRTIVPLDVDTILNSVKKTGKVLIVHEASKTSGFGAEIAAIIAEKAFTYLDAPIQRVCGKDCPVPYSKPLEDAVLPQKSDIEEAIISLAAF